MIKQTHVATLVVIPTTVLLLLALLTASNAGDAIVNTGVRSAGIIISPPSRVPATASITRERTYEIIKRLNERPPSPPPSPEKNVNSLRGTEKSTKIVSNTTTATERILQIPSGGNPQPPRVGSPISAPPVTSMVYFIFDYGFDGLTRDPTVEEVDAMLCHTNEYIFQRMTDSLAALGDTNPITVRDWYIDWTFDETANLPLQLFFHCDIRYFDDSGFVDKDVVFSSFELSPDDVAEYITQYVWQVDLNNIFYYANQVDYRLSKIKPGPDIFRLDRTHCGETRPPTPAPGLPTLPPTNPPTAPIPAPDTPANPVGGGPPQAPDGPADSPGISNPNTPPAPTETPNTEEKFEIPSGGNPQPSRADTPIAAPPVTSMVYFIFDYGFDSGLAREPTAEEVDAMICYTNEYIFQRVTAALAALGDTNPITIRDWYIDWTFDETAALPLEVVFHSDIRYADDSAFVAKDAIFSSFELTADDVAEYITQYVWQVNVENIFYYAVQVDYRLRSVQPGPDVFKLERTYCGETRPSTTTTPPATTPTSAPLPATPPPAATPATTTPPATTPPAATSTPANPNVPDGPVVPPGIGNPNTVPAAPSDATAAPAEPSGPLVGSIGGGNFNPRETPPPTQPPETAPPTQAPTTPAPITAAPITAVPTTIPPTSLAPTTATPATTSPPATPVAATEAPAPDTPGTTDAPASTDAPATPGATNRPATTDSPQPPEEPGIINIPNPSTPAPTTIAPTVTPGSPSAAPTSAAPTVTSTVSAGNAEVPTPMPLDEPVAFQMEFTWRDPTYMESSPSSQDINDMLCHTNLFMDERLKVAIDNDVVISDITNVNWGTLVQSDALRVTVDFILTAVYGGMLELIPPNVVLAALESSDADLLEYLRKGDGDSNVFAEDNLFHHFSHVSLQSLDMELEAPGQIPVVENCPENIVEPTPEVLGEPLDSAAVPNIPIPLDNDFGSNEGNIDNSNNNEGTPDPGGEISSLPGSNDNGATSSPREDTLGPASTPSPGGVEHDNENEQQPRNYGTPQRIEVSFLVSNLQFITIPTEVNRSGLSESFPVFVEELVQELQADSVRRRSYNLRGRRRRLESVQLEPNSAFVSQLVRTNCGKSAHPELYCHEAQAQYDVTLLEDGSNPTTTLPSDWMDQYTLDTYKAVHDGTYYDVMKRVDPDTPLFIGTVVSGQVPSTVGESSSLTDSWVFWLLIGIVAALVLCICCLCLFLLHTKNKHDKESRDRDAGGAREPLRPQHHHHHRHDPKRDATDDTTPESDPLIKNKKTGDFIDDEDFIDEGENEEFVESDLFNDTHHRGLESDDSFVDDYTVDDDDFAEDDGWVDEADDVFEDQHGEEEKKSESSTADDKNTPRSIMDDQDTDSATEEPSATSGKEKESPEPDVDEQNESNAIPRGQVVENVKDRSLPLNTDDMLDKEAVENKENETQARGKGFDNFEDKSVKELRALCKEGGINTVGMLEKQELVEALRNKENTSEPLPAGSNHSDEDANDLETSIQLEDVFNLSGPLDSTIEYQKKQQEKVKAKNLNPLPTLVEHSLDNDYSEGAHDDAFETVDDPCEDGQEDPIEAIKPPISPELIDIATTDDDDELEIDTPASTFNESIGNEKVEESEEEEEAAAWAGGLPIPNETANSTDLERQTNDTADRAGHTTSKGGYNGSDEAVAWDSNEPSRGGYNGSDGAVAWDSNKPSRGGYNHSDDGGNESGDKNTMSSDYNNDVVSNDNNKFNNSDSSGTWKNYDETVKGLRAIGSSHHIRGEVVSFDDDDSDDDDSDDDMAWEDYDDTDVIKVRDPARDLPKIAEEGDEDRGDPSIDQSANGNGSQDSFGDMKAYVVSGPPVNSYTDLNQDRGNNSSGEVDWVDYNNSSDPDPTNLSENIGSANQDSAGEFSIDTISSSAWSTGTSSSSFEDEDEDEDDAVNWQDCVGEEEVTGNDSTEDPPGHVLDSEKDAKWQDFVKDQEYDSDEYSESIDWEDA